MGEKGLSGAGRRPLGWQGWERRLEAEKVRQAIARQSVWFSTLQSAPGRHWCLASFCGRWVRPYARGVRFHGVSGAAVLKRSSTDENRKLSLFMR